MWHISGYEAAYVLPLVCRKTEIHSNKEILIPEHRGLRYYISEAFWDTKIVTIL